MNRKSKMITAVDVKTGIEKTVGTSEKTTELRVFENWTPALKDGSGMTTDNQTGLPVLQVNSLSSFIQAIGYPKFKFKHAFQIVYRGQTKLHPSGNDSFGRYRFLPSAFRKGQSQKSMQTAIELQKKQVAAVRKANNVFKDVSDRIVEALLQQYGLGSTWIDAVDNIWVALWFACHKVDELQPNPKKRPKGSRNFIHMVRRDPRTEKKAERFAYVLLMKGKDDKDNYATELVDLRCEIPSYFIRPHVQHGLLVRCWHNNDPNMVSIIQGIIRIKLEDALEWLGTGRILSPEMMMPNPNYDCGFRQLLDSEQEMFDKNLDGKFRFPIYC